MATELMFFFISPAKNPVGSTQISQSRMFLSHLVQGNLIFPLFSFFPSSLSFSFFLCSSWGDVLFSQFNPWLKLAQVYYCEVTLLKLLDFLPIKPHVQEVQEVAELHSQVQKTHCNSIDVDSHSLSHQTNQRNNTVFPQN